MYFKDIFDIITYISFMSCVRVVIVCLYVCVMVRECRLCKAVSLRETLS